VSLVGVQVVTASLYQEGILVASSHSATSHAFVFDDVAERPVAVASTFAPPPQLLSPLSPAPTSLAPAATPIATALGIGYYYYHSMSWSNMNSFMMGQVVGSQAQRYPAKAPTGGVSPGLPTASTRKGGAAAVAGIIAPVDTALPLQYQYPLPRPAAITLGHVHTDHRPASEPSSPEHARGLAKTTTRIALSVHQVRRRALFIHPHSHPCPSLVLPHFHIVSPVPLPPPLSPEPLPLHNAQTHIYTPSRRLGRRSGRTSTPSRSRSPTPATARWCKPRALI